MQLIINSHQIADLLRRWALFLAAASSSGSHALTKQARLRCVKPSLLQVPQGHNIRRLGRVLRALLLLIFLPGCARSMLWDWWRRVIAAGES